jgi:transposase
VVAKRLKYYQNQPQLNTDRLVFLDEAGFNTGMSNTYAWDLKGQTPLLLRRRWGKRFTAIGAIATDGIRGLRIIENTVNGSTFVDYLKNTLGPNLKKGDILVMDSASIHKVAEVKQVLDAMGVEVLFLPPYSPEFNPIEMAWGYMKSKLRPLAMRVVEKLKGGVEFLWSSIEKNLCQRWIRHCGYILNVGST